MEKKRALLVGAGSMGRAWAKTLLECDVVELAGVVDIAPQALDAFFTEIPLTNASRSTDLGGALEHVKPDFLVDVTVPEAHCTTTLEALGRGVPVIGEKPMAASMEEARQMVAASEHSGTLYMVSQSRRYNPQIESFRRAVRRIGNVEILNADFYLGPHFGGFRDQMESPLLVDMAIHTFDQARMLTGSDPVSVYCEAFNPSWSWYAGKASATALFEMSDGLRFCYRGSWCADGMNTSWEAEWRAVGELGSATWDGSDSINGELRSGEEGFMRPMEAFRLSPPTMQHQGIAGSLRDFLRALDDPSHLPQGACADNIKSLAMVFAAVESARSGKRVQIDPMP